MREIRNTLLVGGSMHVGVFLVLIIYKVFSWHGFLAQDVHLWRILIFVLLAITSFSFMLLFMSSLERKLNSIDSSVHDVVFENGFFDYNSFSPLRFAFSKKSENNDINDAKTYAKRYYFLQSFCFIYLWILF